TELKPGGEGLFALTVRNVGTDTSEGEVKVVDHLPLGVTFKEPFDLSGWSCFGTTTVTCKTAKHLTPYFTAFYNQRLQFFVSVDPLASGIHDNTATMSGAGSEPVSDVDPIVIGNSGFEEFGFIPESVDGDAYAEERPGLRLQRQAGGHPFEL